MKIDNFYYAEKIRIIPEILMGAIAIAFPAGILFLIYKFISHQGILPFLLIVGVVPLLWLVGHILNQQGTCHYCLCDYEYSNILTEYWHKRKCLVFLVKGRKS